MEPLARILAIVPSTMGFGFAVMEQKNTLVDWGAITVQGDKNAECLVKVASLIKRYAPDVIVAEDCTGKDSRRSPRIKRLQKRIIGLAEKRRIRAFSMKREHARSQLLGEIKATKDHIAHLLADRFPNELSIHLPPKRRPWMKEDNRLYLFEAVCIALAAWNGDDLLTDTKKKGGDSVR